MKVLITGIDGYLGSLLAPVLNAAGHEVTGLDTGYYKSGWLYNPEASFAPYTLVKDVREVTAEELEGIDAVVHMAELSNDPTGELSPEITYEINHKGSVRLARAAKSAGVKRFVYMSSCSVYGVASDGDVTEADSVNPQTAYAECKTFVERDVGALAEEGFSPTFMRNATAFGASPRMRFDIVLNDLCGLALTTKEIRMISDGTPWRPLVHGLDIAKAIRCALDAPIDAVHNEIFNVGSSEQNYQVKEIAEIVAAEFPGCRVTFGNQPADNRSYRVNFDKIHRQLPGFDCDWNAEAGAHQLRSLFDRIRMDSEQFKFRGFTRLKQLEYLIRTGQIDSSFFWTRTGLSTAETAKPEPTSKEGRGNSRQTGGGTNPKTQGERHAGTCRRMSLHKELEPGTSLMMPRHNEMEPGTSLMMPRRENGGSTSSLDPRRSI